MIGQNSHTNQFIIKRSELEGRIDPFFYKQEFVNQIKQIKNSKFKSVRFSELINAILNGYDFRNYKDEGTPYLKVANVKKGEIDFSKIQFIDFDSSNISKAIQLKKGNLLLTRKGTYGNAFSLDRDYDYVISSEVFYISLNQEKIDSKYLEIFFNSDFGQRQFCRVSIGAIMGSLSQEAVRNVYVVLPDKLTQQKIVKLYLNAYNTKKQKEQETQELLNGIDTYLLNELGITIPEKDNSLKSRVFTIYNSNSNGDRIDPNFYLPFYSKLVSSIQEKEFSKLNHIIKFSSESWNQKDFFDETFPYIEISEINLSTGKIMKVNSIPVEKAPSRAKMIVRTDDVILSLTRPHRGAIARIEEENNLSIASTGFAVLRKLKSLEISKDYLFEVLRNPLILNQLQQRSTGGNYPAITMDQLGEVIIPLTSVKKQKEIVKHIKNIRTRAKQLQEEAKELLNQAKATIENLILN